MVYVRRYIHEIIFCTLEWQWSSFSSVGTKIDETSAFHSKLQDLIASTHQNLGRNLAHVVWRQSCCMTVGSHSPLVLLNATLLSWSNWKRKRSCYHGNRFKLTRFAFIPGAVESKMWAKKGGYKDKIKKPGERWNILKTKEKRYVR